WERSRDGSRKCSRCRSAVPAILSKFVATKHSRKSPCTFGTHSKQRFCVHGPSISVERKKTRRRFSAAARDRVLMVVSPVVVLLIWQGVCELGLVDMRFVPSPVSIALAAVHLAQTGELWSHVSISVWRLTLGFVVGAIPGFLIGLLMGLSPWA